MEVEKQSGPFYFLFSLNSNPVSKRISIPTGHRLRSGRPRRDSPTDGATSRRRPDEVTVAIGVSLLGPLPAARGARGCAREARSVRAHGCGARPHVVRIRC
jgi:hypothetical protein